MQLGKTLVAVFDERSQAEQALDALTRGGFSSSNARIAARQDPAARSTVQPQRDESLGEKIAEFFGFGSHHESTYSEAVRRGGYVLTVEAANEDEAERAADLLERYHPVDIDERQAQWRQSGWQPAQAGADERTIPVVEEELKVGKREVQRGGIRVLSRVTERPVQETVELREEHANIERRPANRAVTESDRAFTEQSIEIRETAEEPVVAKTARVVEDVVVGKQRSTHKETIQDTVRKTDVEVKRSGGQERRRSTATYTGMERRGA